MTHNYWDNPNPNPPLVFIFSHLVSVFPNIVLVVSCRVPPQPHQYVSSAPSPNHNHVFLCTNVTLF